MTLACNSSSVASAGIATISGRGVITSRTRLSLNSTTCSIRSPCSGSMMPSSSAASTNASIPSSVRCSSVFSTSCSEIRASDSAPSRNTRTGQTSHMAPRISGKRGTSQRPVVRYNSMSGIKCIAMTTSSTRKTQNSTKDSQVPGTKYTTPRVVSRTRNASQKCPRIRNVRPPLRRLIFSFGSISASKISKCIWMRPVVMRPSSR